MAFRIKIKNKSILLIVAADNPKILQAISSQLMTGFDKICSFRLKILSVLFNPLEQPAGPVSN
jgi:hypothetical protein